MSKGIKVVGCVGCPFFDIIHYQVENFTGFRGFCSALRSKPFIAYYAADKPKFDDCPLSDWPRVTIERIEREKDGLGDKRHFIRFYFKGGLMDINERAGEALISCIRSIGVEVVEDERKDRKEKSDEHED